MNNLGRALAKAVDPQNLFRFAVKQNLQRTNVHADDLRPCEVFKLRTAHFIRHFHGGELLFGFPDGADLRNGVDPGRDILNQMRGSFAFNHRLCGDTPLIVSR